MGQGSVVEFTFVNNPEYWRPEFHEEPGTWWYEYDGPFRITIEGRVWFEESLAVLEFLRDAVPWALAGRNPKRSSSSMEYDCVETEDNPLIAFVLEADGWYVRSPWQNFECAAGLARGELERAVRGLLQQVVVLPGGPDDSGRTVAIRDLVPAWARGYADVRALLADEWEG